MKTKATFLAMMVMISFSSIALASDPRDPKVVVINHKETGIFKLIYKGEKVGKVNLKIYNASGIVVFTETINEVDGFSKPLNFEGMNPGEYLIEIRDNNGSVSQKINYRFESIVNKVHIARIADEGKYLVAMGDNDKERINVKIFDGNNKLVHDQDLMVKSNFGVVFNLQKVEGTPTFEVTDKTGKVRVIKY